MAYNIVSDSVFIPGQFPFVEPSSWKPLVFFFWTGAAAAGGGFFPPLFLLGLLWGAGLTPTDSLGVGSVTCRPVGSSVVCSFPPAVVSSVLPSLLGSVGGASC